MNVPSVAALDCGTNSTRLLIADTQGVALAREMRITRLGQGVDATRRLAPEAMERTLAVLREFKVLMDEHGVARTRLVATAAVRDATNGVDFLRRATQIVGVGAELLGGEEEGRLAFDGATAGLPASTGDTVVVDIGGGSTELVMEQRGSIVAVSLHLGCVRISERFLSHDPPLPAEMEAARLYVEGELERADAALPHLRSLREPKRLIGLAGTVSTLVALDLDLREYTREAVHHATLTRRSVETWCHVLEAETAAERAERPAIAEGRQDVILGGAIVLLRVMSHYGFADCLVSESDILDGLVRSLNAC